MHKPLLLLATTLATLLVSERADAVPIYWDGSGTGWDSAASWSSTSNGTGANQLPTSSDVATFSSSNVTTSQTVNLNADQAVLGLSFIQPVNTSVTLQGGGTNRTLSLGTSGISLTTGASAFTSIFNIGSATDGQNVNLSLQGSQSWLFNGTNAGGSGIMVRNAVSLGVAGTHTLTLGGGIGSTGISLINGNVSDGGVDRTLSLTLNPSSSNNRWTLGGNNSFTGVTTITAGALGITSANALGSTTAGTTVASGAGLFIRNTITNIAAEALTLAGTGPSSLGALRNVTGDSTWNGTIAANTSANVRIGSDSSVLTLSSTADITTTGSNTLEFTTNGAAGSGTIIVNGNISGNAAVAKVVGTANVLTFGGDAKTYTGATTVSAGAFVLNTALTNTSGVTVAAGAALRGNGGSINTAATTTINGALGPGVTLSPATIGTLSTGALSLTSTATFQLDISTGTLAKDLVNVTGNLLLDPGNATILTINDINPLALTSGAFVFIDYSGTWNGGLFKVGGTVIGDNADSFVISGNEYQIDYDYGGANGAVALLVVPEPGVAVSLLGGLGMLAGLQRLRRRAKP